MKTLSISMLFICLLQGVKAQVSGRVTTSNGQPLAYVTVSLIKAADSSSVKSMLTTEQGGYSIADVSAGKYRLKLSSIGYQTWFSASFDISGSKDAKYLAVIVMKEDTRQLGEVVVRGSKPLYQQRSDGLVVNVENSILTKGSTALEVLERSPGVAIDHRDNGISLNGKGGATVMINGKLIRMPLAQVMNLLNGTNADNIEKIELLSTPPAGYDAEGSAGIINIVMKKSKKPGTNGSYSLTGGYGMGEKGTAGINLNHNTKNVNLYGSYTFQHDRTYTDLFITGSQYMPFIGGNAEVEFYTKTKRVSNNHNATLGTDIKLDTQTTLSASVSYNNIHSPNYTYSNAGYNILPDSLLRYIGNINGNNRLNNITNSLSIERVLKGGEKIGLEADYIHYNSNAPTQVNTSFVNKHGEQVYASNSVSAQQQRGFANTTINVVVFKADYTNQLSPLLKLETGIKGTHTGSSSSSGIESFNNGAWERNMQTAANIYMKEDIGAAYISLNWQLAKGTSLNTGARYEYSYTNMDNPQTGGNIVNRKLGKLFPTILFTTKLAGRSELQLSYTKRIARPSYDDLASYFAYSDPTAVYTGNPFLKPTITNNIKLGYNYGDYSFSLLYSRDDNAIARYQLSESPAHDILFISPQNLPYQNYLTFQVNAPFKVSNWWEMTYSFVGGLRQFKEDYTLNPLTKSYFGYSFNFNQLFKLSSSFSAEVSGQYNSMFYNGTTRIDGFGVINAGIKKQLKSNAGSLQLAVADVFSASQIQVRYGTLTREAFDIKSHVIVNTETRHFPVIKLTYTKSFGGTGLVNRNKQDNGSKEERERLRNN
ncbi:TonB-dependent receptor [Mucilaginibacter sp. SMC90]|uniref:TonB-dependent receptor domain-containing protein n=1 Tax=Mucilaginibacter sp. SMC90 TaxID=2929803 RepID=UPI001FB3D3C6|nr:TonB-dependent receptor [Mucilaginibacter sp. SMC90]UOE50670.1 TonB-dependent receptor [Mucilaginibacter sp. SMC90]